MTDDNVEGTGVAPQLVTPAALALPGLIPQACLPAAKAEKIPMPNGVNLIVRNIFIRAGLNKQQRLKERFGAEQQY